MRISWTFWTVSLFLCSVTLSMAYKRVEDHSLLRRLIRAAGSKKQECRYEKKAWEECDPSSGLQRRELKLKANSRSTATHCEAIKHISRPCKKACRYSKGTWNECANGEKTRTDTIKTGSTAGCEPTRVINKKCKPVCRYSKSEWTPCENGTKAKTLTLTEGDGADCEPSKTINKQCGQTKQRSPKHGLPRGRKNNSAGSGSA